jgi:hypothetical protein
LLPALGDDAAAGARALGAAAAALAGSVERRLLELLPALGGPSGPPSGSDARPRLPLDALRRLPAELLPWALALLHRRSGAAYPPRAVAIAELRRQLHRSDRVHCDCGAGWQWRTDSAGRLRVEPAPAGASPFTYTVGTLGTADVPGTADLPEGVEISEAGTTVRPPQPAVTTWPRRGAPDQAAHELPAAATAEAR